MSDKQVKYLQTDYICAHCQENNWTLNVEHIIDEDTNQLMQTSLVVACKNPKCYKERKKELNVEDKEDVLIIWEEFNITNQGYDSYADDALSSETSPEKLLN